MDSITISQTENLLLMVQLSNNSATITATDSDTDCKVIQNNCINKATDTTAIVASSSSNKCGVMGVENTWNEEENFCVPTAADFPIPLPPPPVGFDDLSSTGCSVDGVEPGTLEGLFASDEPNQIDHLLVNDGDISDVNSEAGVCGLRNLGNTCFMSTGVQCLVATPSLIRCLLDETVDKDDTSDSLTSRLAALTNKMWSGHYSSVQPADFKYSLGAHYPQFKDFRQHDCQEFLALLLDGLHEQMNCANSKLCALVCNNSIVSDESIVENDSIKQKLDCESNQCNECWSPKKGCVDFNNFNYNNSNMKFGKKGFGEDRNNCGITKSVMPLELHLQSSLGTEIDKNADEVGQSNVVNEFTVNNNKINGVCNNLNDSTALSNDVHTGSKRSVDDVSSDISDNYMWYNGSCLTDIQDIIKDAKTSNVNVLVTEQENNNEIRFDSDKYPKSENSLRRKETLNFNAFHIYDNNTSNNNNSSGKRVKSTVTHFNCVTDFREGLDLKRIKMHRLDCDDFEKDKNQRMEYQNIKSKTLDINLVEKNLRIECERKQRELDNGVLPADIMSVVSDSVAGASGGGYCISSHLQNGKNCMDTDCNDILDDEDSSEGHTHWEKHIAANQSVIVDTFQGQFKSTVVCSACKYVSVTYEPFMYLSVPLPHAMERQICVIFVPSDNSYTPIKYLITLNKRDKISKLKQQLIQLLNDKEIKSSSIILAEVFDNHIAKILNDNHLIRYVDDINRSIYAFQLLTPTSTSTCDKSLEQMTDDEVSTTPLRDVCDYVDINNASKDWSIGDNDMCGIADDDQQMTISKSCTICLEEKESNMQRHYGCNCVLCDGCVLSSFQHYGGDSLMCPVCRVKLNPLTDLVPVENDIPSYPVVRLLLVPIVYRIDILGDGNNNKKTVKLFGHPNVIRLNNNIDSQELYKVMSNIVPHMLPYKILLVDGQGRHCSRCMFNAHCRGCAVNNMNGSLNLTTGDTLAITFTEAVEEPLFERHSSMADLRSQQPLTLYDCIQAFSQSEVLDKQNPWYCPKCQKNQCATKTLSVWRCPDYLIVYLKRFVFQDGMSTKLEDKVMFPFHGLKLSSIAFTTVYDLYACVCHVGGVSAGHYTAYTQHPKTEEWHYYNDDVVAKQMPQEEDYSNAYILFYKKRGLATDVSSANINDGGEGCSSYNTM